MITTENLPLEGKIKINLTNTNTETLDFILKRNIYGDGTFVTLKTLELSQLSFTSQGDQLDSNEIRAISYGAGLYVIAGANGKLATSPNGTIWTFRTSSFGTDAINSIVYGNGFFVAVGESGKLATSTDGINWTQKTSNVGSSNLNSIDYGGGIFVAVGDVQKMTTSTDGEIWTLTNSALLTSFIYSVAYGNNMWIAMGDANEYSTSLDGLSWTRRTTIADTSWINSTRYGNGLWVIVGSNGEIGTSEDGLSWDFQLTTVFGASNINDVYYGLDIWVACGGDGKVAFATNGLDWSLINSDFGILPISTAFYSNNLWLLGRVGGILSTSYRYLDYLYDTYAQNNVQYVYSLVPIVAGEEGTAETSTILSIFCDSFICGANSIYKITDELSYNNFGRNKRGNIVDSFGRKYPIVHSFGVLNYTNGSIDFHLNSISSSNIISQDEIAYRKQVLAFFTNKGAKIIKDINGNIWLVVLYNLFPQAFLQEIGNQTCNISADFVTIGDANTQSDLSRAGLLEKFILYTE